MLLILLEEINDKLSKVKKDFAKIKNKVKKFKEDHKIVLQKLGRV